MFDGVGDDGDDNGDGMGDDVDDGDDDDDDGVHLLSLHDVPGSHKNKS